MEAIAFILLVAMTGWFVFSFGNACDRIKEMHKKICGEEESEERE